jgi:hypothetical protein|tara:strand:- start:5922 stop:6266 length:345 start_codon:yes stop_codon:yes gene_type:complete
MAELKVGQLVRIGDTSNCTIKCSECVKYEIQHRSHGQAYNCKIHRYAVEGAVVEIATVDEYISKYIGQTDHTICLSGYGYFTPEEVEVLTPQEQEVKRIVQRYEYETVEISPNA